MNKRIVFGAFLAMSFFLVPGTSHARWLNPNTGRFQTMDTYQGDNEDPLSLHKYLYGADNPVNVVDPSGHFTEVEVMVATEIDVELSILVNGVILYAAYQADQILAESYEKRAINEFVATHSEGGLTQDDFNKLVKTARWPQPSKPLYLHYGRSENAASLLPGLWTPSWATRTVYYTGWQAKLSLALPHVEPPNAAYILRPKGGFQPVGPNLIPGGLDDALRPMPGGGQEWKFINGSGGPGSVFGPIPVPEGRSPF
jgi:hypothetical protein